MSSQRINYKHKDTKRKRARGEMRNLRENSWHADDTENIYPIITSAESVKSA